MNMKVSKTTEIKNSPLMSKHEILKTLIQLPESKTNLQNPTTPYPPMMELFPNPNLSTKIENTD